MHLLASACSPALDACCASASQTHCAGVAIHGAVLNGVHNSVGFNQGFGGSGTGKRLKEGKGVSKQFQINGHGQPGPEPLQFFCDCRSQGRRRVLRLCRSSIEDSYSWAMPEDHEALPAGLEVVPSVLDATSFLAGLMPKNEIGVVKFLDEHPEYDGRGIVVAIFDSGVDPAAAGLQTTTDGKPKVIDVLDCTGSGDVDTSTVVKADEDGFIIGASGVKLLVNKSWRNPSGQWHVGSKFAYQLFTDTLINRLKKERRKKWDEKHHDAQTKALRQLTNFDLKHPKPVEISLKKEREDLQTRIDLLQKGAETYQDKGPVLDAVVWHDGEVWRVALDTQDMEDEVGVGKLADFTPLTNYRIEHKYGTFTKMDACTFVTNVYDDGNVLSIVTDSSPHGTHVAGITAAYHPEEPILNGVAPGAQLVSCKIGDSRLGSMETGTGLTRALIAVVENKCNLINMSYGEPTTVPNSGRFVELVNEVVDKHGVIFVSSAGNSGPSLSTVGAPGGTTSNILGIGAFVSPVMAAAAHSIVEPPSEGLQYTWSSRGPTIDGDLGVCLSAPGGAVAPVPKWTLQRRMLMNGTSMASPCACGGIALVLSALKAEGKQISPHVVRKALENTASPVSNDLEDLLTTGRGLLQVDRAYDYLQKCTNIPSVSYNVQLTRSSSTTAALRGIYLRDAHDCQQASEWTVQVKPKFHEDADKLELLVPFEERMQLENSVSWVKAPEYLLLTNNGRSFNVMVDPTSLREGVHYSEVVGIDTSAPWRGPLFRVPITVVKPMEVVTRPPVVSFMDLSFTPGRIERKFIAVPEGANWAETVLHVAGLDTPRRFFVNAVQLVKKRRPIVWESVVLFTSPTSKGFSFPIKGGVTMELCIAQYWSSGVGSPVPTTMEVQVKFHGLQAGEKNIYIHGTEGTARVDVKAPLSTERLSPTASLKRVRLPFRPVESKLVALSPARDLLPNGRQISSLTLTYKFTLSEGGKIKPCFPFLNNRLYEAEFESQLYMITDVNKRVLSTGDCYPKGVKLAKGEYMLRVHIRHDNIGFLEKLKKATVFIDRTLDEKSTVKLSIFSRLDGPVTGKYAFKAVNLSPGETWPFYIAAPADEKLPKDAVLGTTLIGKITFGMEHINENSSCPASSEITYVVSPAFKAEEKTKEKNNVEAKKSLGQKIEEEVRDAKIKLLSSLPLSTPDERKEWDDLVTTLKGEYPKHLQLFVEILQKLAAAPTPDDELIIKAADDIELLIDRDELARFFAMKSEAETADAAQVKKEMEIQRDALAEALYKKGLSLLNLEEQRMKNQPVSQSHVASAASEIGGVASEDNVVVDGTEPESAVHGSGSTEGLPSRASETTRGDPERNTDLPLQEKKIRIEVSTAVLDVPNNGSGAVLDEIDSLYAELRKWADTSSPKYGLLTVRRERRAGRYGSAIKLLNDLIQDEGKPPQKHLYELRTKYVEEVGWSHWAAHEKRENPLNILLVNILSRLQNRSTRHRVESGETKETSEIKPMNLPPCT